MQAPCCGMPRGSIRFADSCPLLKVLEQVGLGIAAPWLNYKPPYLYAAVISVKSFFAGKHLLAGAGRCTNHQGPHWAQQIGRF